MSKSFSIKINGIDIKSDSLYEIMPKKDNDAPEYFTKNGTSKLLMEGISQGAPCKYDTSTHSWDTGFYEKSPCYRGWREQEVKTQVQALQEHIVKPFEEIRGEDILSHRDTKDSFWLSFGSSSLWTGRILNTAKEEDLLTLYIAALGRYICSREDQNNPIYQLAMYTVVNKEAAVSVREERKKFKAEAIGAFMKLYESDKPKLKEVLLYLGLPSIEEGGATSVVMDYVENKKEGHNNAERLLKTIEKVNTKTGAAEVNIYSQLSELFKKGVIRRIASEYFLEEISLGMDLKSAALQVKKSAPLKEALKKAITQLED